MRFALFICLLMASASVAFAGLKKSAPKPEGLTLRISVPSKTVEKYEKFPDYGTIPAFFILTNGGSKPIRYSTMGDLVISTGLGGNHFNVWLTPGFFQMDGESMEQVAKGVKVMQPGESVKLPFKILFIGAHKTVYVTASYATLSPELKEMGLWQGKVEAEPLTLELDN